MNGWCSHCHREGEVSRFRIPGVGLRFLDEGCSGRLDALGMVLTPVVGEPRRPVVGRRVAWTPYMRGFSLGRGSRAA